MHPGLFITATDTGAGKTVLTALLLAHLRARGLDAVAVKPFATGSLADAEILDRLQDRAVPIEVLTPFFFRDPLAPLLAARREGRVIRLSRAVAAIRGAQDRRRLLLIEGCGGLLTPLGSGFDARKLILALGSRVIVAVPNRLGAINQALLVLDALTRGDVRPAAVVLMQCSRPDHSAPSNTRLLRELAIPVPVFELPHLGPRICTPARIREAATKHRRLLARLAAAAFGTNTINAAAVDARRMCSQKK